MSGHTPTRTGAAVSVWDQAESDELDDENLKQEPRATVLGLPLPSGISRRQFRDYCTLLVIQSCTITGFILTMPLVSFSLLFSRFTRISHLFSHLFHSSSGFIE